MNDNGIANEFLESMKCENDCNLCYHGIKEKK
jgi:hypothetical protein